MGDKEKHELFTMDEFLKRFSNVAAALQAQADQMRKDVKTRARKKLTVDVGRFYQTYNNSFVSCIGVKSAQCNCPRCVARRQQQEQMKKTFGHLLNAMVIVEPEEDEDKGEQTYIITVLSGGHGVNEWSGAGPGSSYEVTQHGIVFGLENVISGNARHDGISAAVLGLAGMNLMCEKKPNFEEI